jgi:hypothetical protein
MSIGVDPNNPTPWEPTPEEKAASEAAQQQRVATQQAVTAEQKAQQWEFIRFVRDQQLLQTDWIVSPNVPPDIPGPLAGKINSSRQAWLTWRQALRDMVVETNDPTTVVWPTKPATPPVSLSAIPSFLTQP